MYEASPPIWAKSTAGTKNGPTSTNEPDDDEPARPNG